MPNRLAGETSPYLLQHKDNPVDWYPWGEEALARAREEDRPILLSIGYSACHWCHVMERESFEDEQTAGLMNELFVCIKLDREERPDLDAIYMQVTQAMTGSGGWPMTVFLTPEQVPFYAGTYFPPQPRMGMPSWRQVLEAVAHAWEEKKELWSAKSPFQVESLVLAGDRLYAAGPVDRFRRTPGGRLAIFSAADGKALQEIALDARPVPDGLSVANGRLYACLEDGRLVCYGE